jgi:hypothetical protein
MPVNRWIGQAAPTPEIRFFVPENVQAGDKFQLTDGVNKYGYTYPLIPYEQDDTAIKRARRICNSIATLEVGGGGTFGGGASGEGLQFLSSDWNGKPAIKVIGLGSGQPLGLIPTAVTTAGTTIRIQKMQAGENAADFVFRLSWPITPTKGKWAISANGKNPAILNYNASAADLRAAIVALALPCADVTVTGSHSAGYTVNLTGLTDTIPDPPLLFPIVPIQGSNNVVTMTFLEHSTYRIGPAGTAYDTTNYFEANITVAAMRTYLASTSRMGAFATESHLGLSFTRVARSSGFTDGTTWTFTFKTEAAWNRFLSLDKKRLVFDYRALNAPTVLDDYLVFDPTTAAGWTSDPQVKKWRQMPGSKTTSGEVYNPDTKFFYSTATSGIINRYFTNPVFTTPGTFTEEAAMVSGLEENSPGGSGIGVRVRFNCAHRAHDLSVGNDVPSSPQAQVGIATSEENLTVINVTVDGFFGLGVSDNAGYAIATTEQPGIINQEIVIPELNQNVNVLYQFEIDGKRSVAFTGASTVAQLKDAAATLLTANNLAVSLLSEGSLCRIAFTGINSELSPTLRLLQLENGANDAEESLVVAVSAATPMVAYKLKYTFTGGVCGGDWAFVNSSGTISQRRFRWHSPVEYSAADLFQAIVNNQPGGYGVYLSESDIAVTSETVGDCTIIRGFEITFEAHPGGLANTDTLVPPFWVGVDASKLLTAEPNYELTSKGAVAKPDIQVVALNNKPTGGTFKLTFSATTSAAIAHNATSATLTTVLGTIGVSANVLGPDGGPWRIRWNANGPQALLVASDNLLTRNNAPTFTAFTDVAGTGPNFFDNDDNWSLGRKPADGDEVVFADGSVDCCYGLLTTALLDSISVYTTFGGKIGLAEIRDDQSMETLPVWLQIDRASGTPLPIRIGLGQSGEGPSVIRIQTLQRAYDATVLATRTGAGNAVCSFKSTASGSRLVVVAGEVSAGVRPEDTGTLDTLMLSPETGNLSGSISFSSSAGMQIVSASVAGGTANFGQPPTNLIIYSGEATVNGNGVCNKLDITNGTVRWLAGGTIGRSAAATAVLFGSGLTSSSATPEKIRITSPTHGLNTGDRVYVRSKGAVQNVDGKVYAVVTVDANNFDLIGSAATGTLVGYAGTLQWALEKTVIVRVDGEITFDSDGRTRDIVAPIIIQGNAIVSDIRMSIADLRIWPEFVETLAFLGQTAELRRSAR